MARFAVAALEHRLEAAYRADPFHALLRNVESVRPDEWDVRPEEHSAAEFGTQPELSICDLVIHVAGAKVMYGNRAFGSAVLEWGDITVPASRDMASVLAWLDDAHRTLVAGLSKLTDDNDLAANRPMPWGMPLRLDLLLGVVSNHDLYHSGELNRQRALIRGAKGWARPG